MMKFYFALFFTLVWANVFTVAQAQSISTSHPTNFCAGDSAVLQATTNPLYSYEWYINNTAINGSNTSTYSAKTSGNYTCKINTGLGIVTTNAISITVNSINPNLFYGNITTFYLGRGFKIKAFSSASYSYQWILNNTFIIAAADSIYTAITSGNYSCILINQSCKDTTETLNLLGLTFPGATITASGPLSFCTGSSVKLTGIKKLNLSYQWQKNGVNIAGAVDSFYTATTSGSYRYILTGPLRNDTSNSVVVTASPKPIASLSPTGPLSFCQGDSVLLSSSSSTGVISWYKNSTLINNVSTTFYFAKTSGTFHCAVTQNGCADSSNKVKVTATPFPIAQIFANSPTQTCANVPVHLNALYSLNYKYKWQRNGVDLVNDTTENLFTSIPGSYTCIVSNGSCRQTSNNINISNKNNTNAAISILGSNNLCNGDSVLLSAVFGANIQYQWLRNGAVITGKTNQNIYVKNSGNYSCIFTENSCFDTSNVIGINLFPKPIATITAGGPTIFCQGENVVLSAQSVAGNSYTWQRNGVNIGTGASFNASQSGNYRCIVINQNCTDTSNVIAVTANIIVSASIVANGTTSFCQGGSVLLTANSGAGFVYSWLRNGAPLSGGNNINYTANISGNYSCIVFANGCSDTSNTILVSVATIPTVIISSNGQSTSICPGSSVALSTNLTGNYTYQWKLNGINIPNSNNNTFNANSTGNYTCVVSSNGCSGNSNGLNVTILPSANANISALSNTTFCQGQSVTLESNNAPGYQFTWLKNNVIIANSNNYRFTATTAGNYKVIINYNGCPDTSNSLTVVVNPKPIAGITPLGFFNFNQGDSLVLNATPTTGVTYLWLQNGVAIPATNNARFVAYSSGNYRCVVSNGNCSDTTVSVVVTVNPISSFTISASKPLVICQGDTNIFTVMPTSATYSYVWKRNGTVINGASGTNYAATTSGNYVCEVTAGGVTIASNSLNLTVNPRPTAAITATTIPVTICSGDSAILTANFGTGYTYQWYKSGVAISGATNRVFRAFTSGNYTCLVNLNGCTELSNSINVQVNQMPTAQISASGNTAFVTGDSVLILLSAVTGATYQWQKNGVNIPNATSAFYYAKTSGNYTCRVTLNNCSSVSNTVVITAFPSTIRNISPSGSSSICSGTRVKLMAYSANGMQYQWLKNGSPIAFATDSFYFANSTGSYTCNLNFGTLNVTAGNYNLTVVPKPVAAINATSTTVFCLGDSVLLSSNTSTGYTYLWQKNNINIPGQTSSTLNVKTDGSYRCIITSNGCLDTSNIINVVVKPVPIATITASGPTVILSGASVTLNAATGTGYSYQWYKDGNLISGAINAFYLVSQTGNYTCFVSLNGCPVLSNLIRIEVLPANTFTITASGVTTFCAGDSVTLSTQQGSNRSYQWVLNGNNIAGATASFYVAKASGTYLCKITINGTSSNSNSIAVTVNPKPNISVNPSTIQSICQGQSINLTVINGQSTAIQWYRNSFILPGKVNTIYAADTSGNYTAIASLNGCKDTSNLVQVIVKPRPNAFIAAGGPTTFISGDSVIFTAPLVTGYAYQWYKDSVILVGKTTSTYTALVSGNYHCVITQNGCSSVSNVIKVTVLPPSAYNIVSGGATSFCQGDSVVLLANTGLGYAYQWQLNGSNLAGATQSSYTVKISGNYTCRITFNSIVRVSNNIAVTVIAKPIASISATGPTSFCSGSNVTLSASTGAGYQYQWMLNSNNIAGATGNQIIASSNGAYNCLVTINGCSNVSNIINTNVTTTPVANITASGSITFFSGDSVILNANISAGLQYTWLLNGSPIASSNNSAFTALQSGNYQCVLNINGCVDTSNTIIVTVIPSSVIGIAAYGPVNFCTGSNVTLIATAGTNYQYQWRLNGLILSGQMSQSINVASSGNYSCDVSTGTSTVSSNIITVTVSNKITAFITPGGPTTFFKGGSVPLVANGGSNLTYRWLKDGLPILGSNGILLQVDSSGSYQVEVDHLGCKDTSQAVNINCIDLSFTKIVALGDTNFCAGDTLFLKAKSNSLFTYRWRKNGLVIPNQTDSILKIWNSGIYNCDISINSSTVNSNSVIVTVFPAPNANVRLFGKTSFCQNDSALLSADFIQGFNYSWEKDGNIIFGANALSFIVKSSGRYRCIVSNSICSDTSVNYNFTVNPVPNAFTGDEQYICVGEKVRLGIDSVAGNSYLWTGPGFVSNIAKPTVSPQANALYTLRETINATGCAVSNSVKVNLKPNIDASFALSDTLVDVGQTVTVTINGSTFDLLIIDYGDNTQDTVSGLGQLQHFYTLAGNYTIKTLGTSVEICADSAFARIKVVKNNVVKDQLIYPNPTQGNFTINYNNSSQSNIFILVYDNKGDLTKYQYYENVPQGFNSFNMDISDAQEGIYHVFITDDINAGKVNVFENGQINLESLNQKSVFKLIKVR